MRKLIYAGTVAVLLCSMAACKGKAEGDKFNRAAMLANVGNNVIAPAHQTFAGATANLKQQATSFVNNPDATHLQALKAAYIEAYEALQAVETYSFDPSADLRTGLNSFPADTNQINNNASSAPGSYNLNTANNVRAKGFPALDYLLYGTDEATTLNLFASANRQSYLTAIISDIDAKASTANNAWGSYMQQFTQADGIDIGSSVGMLVNDVAFSAERCRRERVGNSLGYVGFISSGSIYPYSLEAYYSTQSKALLVVNLQQLKALYEGGAGEGFDDYLASIDAQYDGQPLSTAISTQFDVAIAKANAVPVDFGTALSSNKPAMEELFLELKKLTVMLKVDMSSQLGVVINYSDNDGD